MGMDIYGKNPTSPEGEYFRNNCWYWQPLASYACEIAPAITANCRYWQSNDGDGLDGALSLALANTLQLEIDAGRTAAYEKRYRSEQKMAPNEPCYICAGTGTRNPVPECGAGDIVTGLECNGCGGSGYIRPSWADDRFSEDNVKSFVAFLRTCGGFTIC
jgi:hypothetical protein